jgi:dipeptidyl aminopeptidase/acylaminoacyl peptidase
MQRRPRLLRPSFPPGARVPRAVVPAPAMSRHRFPGPDCLGSSGTPAIPCRRLSIRSMPLARAIKRRHRRVTLPLTSIRQGRFPHGRTKGPPGRERSRLVGDPRTLPVAAGANTPYHSAMLSASADLLATVAMPMAYGVRLGTAARDGTAVRMSERQPQNWPRLSPDGRRIARQMVDPLRGNPDIWVENLKDGSLVRVTTATGSDLLAVWSPDGLRLVYGSGTLKERRLSIAAADGTGVAQELPCPGAYCEPTDWSPDGRSLIVNTRLTKIGAGDVWSVSLEAGGSAKPILSEPFPEYDARISPNGQWLAYVSEEAGRPVVSVRAMSGPPRRLVVSSDGGSQPVWRRDGQELLYVDREGRLRGRSVQHEPTGELTLGVANVLSVPVIGSGHWGTQYDVSPDGRNVYFIDRTPAPRPSDIRVVMGWRALLK